MGLHCSPPRDSIIGVRAYPMTERTKRTIGGPTPARKASPVSASNPQNSMWISKSLPVSSFGSGHSFMAPDDYGSGSMLQPPTAFPINYAAYPALMK